ncbi:MAG TPA: lipid A biosynthesis acyltransferase [Halothiobacillaceae bacterium]|nr:lipid A biosynthesis acyltransferase [Halothiobacillaceae bacterium]
MAKTRRHSPWRLWAANAFIGLFSRFSLPVNHRIGRLIGLIAWYTRSKHRRVAEANIARCFPEKSQAQRQQLARQSLIESGKSLTELGPIWNWPQDKIEQIILDMPGFDAVEQTLDQGRGVILLGPHLGAWELGGLAISMRVPTTIMYRPPRDPQFEQLLVEKRSRLGASLAPANLKGVRQAITALKNTELLAVLPDQSPRAGEGEMAPFFGHPALTLTLIRSLVRKTNAAVFVGYAERMPDSSGFIIRFRPASQPVGDADVITALTALNQEVEQSVRACPEQYQWTYPRFRRQKKSQRERLG